MHIHGEISNSAGEQWGARTSALSFLLTSEQHSFLTTCPLCREWKICSKKKRQLCLEKSDYAWGVTANRKTPLMTHLNQSVKEPSFLQTCGIFEFSTHGNIGTGFRNQPDGSF